tara:strand:- start:387 stop:1640 length:1254 start_codon:yes stop_codon:yes gene_type:complete
MAKLTGQTIAASYDQLLIVDDANGISSSLQAIESADTGGSASSLKISTSKVEVIPASDSTSLFEVSQADGTAVLSVDTTNARVGIGLVAPATNLHLQSADTNILRIEDTSSDGIAKIELKNDARTSTFGLFGDDSDKLKIHHGGDYIFAVDTDGKVGIGSDASSPLGKLHIASADTGASPHAGADELVLEGTSDMGMTFLSATDGAGIINFGDSGDNNIGYIEYQHGDNSFRFGAAGSERMRIDSSGNVGIGETSPSNKLVVKGDATTYVVKFVNDGNNANRHGLAVQAGADDGSGTTYYFNADDGDGGNVGYLANTSGTFALTDASDESLKNNIRDTEINGLDTVNSIKVRDFEWKKSGITTEAGFVAQELRESFAPATSEMPDGLLGVSREILVGVLVKAVQELSAKVEALESAQ